jgi:hypothetical protein
MVLGQALAVSQAFSLTKLRNLRLLSQKLKFWESLTIYTVILQHSPRICKRFLQEIGTTTRQVEEVKNHSR